MTVSFNILCIICLLWPTLYCYFASFTIERIASIGNDAYFLKWYYYPPMLQKYFTLIIAQSQGKVQFTGLGLIYCSIETFGKVRIVWCVLFPFQVTKGFRFLSPYGRSMFEDENLKHFVIST